MHQEMIKNAMHSIIEDLDKEAILSIAMMSVLVSILTLSIPVAAQTLINVIAFGKLMQPVLTLSIIVLVLMLSIGALNIWQALIVEVMQQKLMVQISLSLTKQLTQLDFNNFSTNNGPELVNRFFDIFIIKKTLSSLLLYGVNLALQLFFGLLLLVFYHPLLIIFDIFIILGIVLIIVLPYRKGLESSKNESLQKHKLGSWLEEFLINKFLFRFSSYQDYAILQTDKHLVNFLQARSTHFKQLMKHQIGFYVLSALSSSLLLGLGGYLVINNQLSLGQLVAAEIMLGALIYAFNRFGILLENYYDLMVSVKKIDATLSLPIEEIKTGLDNLFIPITKIEIKVPKHHEVITALDEPLLIYSKKADSCKTFIEALFGFKIKYDFEIRVNETLFNTDNRTILRQHSLLLRDPEWFSGTICDNLLLNHRNISNKIIMEQLTSFGLAEKILAQPNGLNTIVYDWQNIFTELEILELMVIRAILLEPQLLVIDRALDKIEQEKIEIIMENLLSLKNTILIVVTQNQDLLNIKNRLVLS